MKYNHDTTQDKTERKRNDQEDDNLIVLHEFPKPMHSIPFLSYLRPLIF